MIYNDELHQIYESLKHLLDNPDGGGVPVDPKLNGSLWLNLNKNELSYFNKVKDEWVNVFAPKFQIVDQLLSDVAPNNPVSGQLWINDGALLYYDGAQWTPIKAVVNDGSQINISAFENFVCLSPLSLQGDSVAMDSRSMNQYLLPTVDIDRLFIDGKLKTDYHKINGVCLQYDNALIQNKPVSAVHVNPGKVINIKKRLFLINGLNPRIECGANSEYYGFTGDSAFGDYLHKADDQESGNYITVNQPPGIYLNQATAEKYKYVLAVTYEFSWVRASGRLNISTNHESSTSFYIVDSGYPVNIFMDGYDVDDATYDYDSLSQTITVNCDDADYQVSLMRSKRREYGFIREVDMTGRGIIKTVNRYIRPLVLVNGQALDSSFGDVEVADDRIFVAGASVDMSWCVIELDTSYSRIGGALAPVDSQAEMVKALFEVGLGGEMCPSIVDPNDGLVLPCYFDLDLDGNLIPSDAEPGSDPFILFEIDSYNCIVPCVSADVADDLYYKAGIVSYGAAIQFDPQELLPGVDVVLFVDGLLVKKEDIIRDDVLHTLTTPYLQQGQEFILLKDLSGNFYSSAHIYPAIKIGRNDESLVYVDGNLICNDTAFVSTQNPLDASLTASNGEIKLFIDSPLDRSSGVYCVWDSYGGCWNTLNNSEIADISRFGRSYDNALSAVKLMLPYTEESLINIWAFNAANQIGTPRMVRSVMPKDRYQNMFQVSTPYLYNVGSLAVWVDGVRQYPDVVTEYQDGTKFVMNILPQGWWTDTDVSHAHKVTYSIEMPARGETYTCVHEILDHTNVVPGAVNVYKTVNPLFPGRATVYVGGLRIPQEAYVIIDSNTIKFKDTTNMLIGSPNNYPMDYVINKSHELAQFERVYDDRILIEVRPDTTFCEATISFNEVNQWNVNLIDYNLPLNMLECQDEIFIFVNGLFTGLRNNLGYSRDSVHSQLTLLSSYVVDALSTDYMNKLLLSDDAAYDRWRRRTGLVTYVPKYTNRLTLEWR